MGDVISAVYYTDQEGRIYPRGSEVELEGEERERAAALGALEGEEGEPVGGVDFKLLGAAEEFGDPSEPTEYGDEDEIPEDVRTEPNSPEWVESDVEPLDSPGGLPAGPIEGGVESDLPDGPNPGDIAQPQGSTEGETAATSEGSTETASSEELTDAQIEQMSNAQLDQELDKRGIDRTSGGSGRGGALSLQEKRAALKAA